jgi:hypothetical protein
VLEEGEVTHKLVQVPLDRLAKWDDEHDAAGAKISPGGSSATEDETNGDAPEDERYLGKELEP